MGIRSIFTVYPCVIILVIFVSLLRCGPSLAYIALGANGGQNTKPCPLPSAGLRCQISSGWRLPCPFDRKITTFLGFRLLINTSKCTETQFTRWKCMRLVVLVDIKWQCERSPQLVYVLNPLWWGRGCFSLIPQTLKVYENIPYNTVLNAETGVSSTVLHFKCLIPTTTSWWCYLWI